MNSSLAELDPYEALADERRRRILTLLAQHSRCTVNELVDALDLPQPAVSKHLAVLKKAGLVVVDKDRQFRRYGINAEPLKTMHDWLATFDRFWSDHLLDIKKAAEKKARRDAAPPQN